MMQETSGPSVIVPGSIGGRGGYCSACDRLGVGAIRGGGAALDGSGAFLDGAGAVFVGARRTILDGRGALGGSGGSLGAIGCGFGFAMIGSGRLIAISCAGANSSHSSPRHSASYSPASPRSRLAHTRSW